MANWTCDDTLGKEGRIGWRYFLESLKSGMDVPWLYHRCTANAMPCKYTLRYDCTIISRSWVSYPSPHPSVPTDHATNTPPSSSLTSARSHPQAQFPTRRPRRNPIPILMKARHSRHSTNPLSTQLRQLFPRPCIHIHEPVHIAHDEPLRAAAHISWMQLPVRFQNSHPAACLIVVRDDGAGRPVVDRVAGRPGVGGREVVDFDGVVVGGRGDLAGGVEGGVRDRELAFVLCDHGGEPGVAFAGDLAEVPELKRAV